MSLPELASQVVYGRFAWTIVLATLAMSLWPASRPTRPALAAILAGVAVLMALPGAMSPAYWLGLAFQYPSGLLLGLCLVALLRRWRGDAPARVMPLAPAAALAGAGLLLYLDAFGLLTRGFYYAGFGPTLVPLLAVLAAAGCAAAILGGKAAPQAGAGLFALALFSLLRLPSGNLWDALIDPLLWGWAVAALVAAALRGLLRRFARPGVQPEPSGLAPELPLARTAPAEHFSTLKEHLGGK
ncbi:hypothetical protein [Massilia niastensis]|uniref:hypothetical protein n=1 Tax=Massilia niastensis TaxID=544911 RepID=UPI00035D5741|nr:hypothetical protein [Massilia niastensis]